MARGPIRLVHGLQERRLDAVNDLWRALSITRQHVYFVVRLLPFPSQDDDSEVTLAYLGAVRDQQMDVLVAVSLSERPALPTGDRSVGRSASQFIRTGLASQCFMCRPPPDDGGQV